MKVFICWSGEASHQVALALKVFLEDIIQDVKAFLSSESIHKGGRWQPELSRQLSECNYGILCLTKHNLNARWVLFEAGALSKNLEEGRVTGLLVGVESSDVESPLSQFQNTGVSRTEIAKLLQSINALLKEPRTESQLNRAFDRYWPDFEKELIAASNLKAPDPAEPPRNAESIQKEILELLRGLARDSEEAKQRVPPFANYFVSGSTYGSTSEIGPGPTGPPGGPAGALLYGNYSNFGSAQPNAIETYQDTSSLKESATKRSRQSE